VISSHLVPSKVRFFLTLTATGVFFFTHLFVLLILTISCSFHRLRLVFGFTIPHSYEPLLPFSWRSFPPQRFVLPSTIILYYFPVFPNFPFGFFLSKNQTSLVVIPWLFYSPAPGRTPIPPVFQHPTGHCRVPSPRSSPSAFFSSTASWGTHFPNNQTSENPDDLVSNVFFF